MAPKKKKHPAAAPLEVLADELIANPREKANNLPVLISNLTKRSGQVRGQAFELRAAAPNSMHWPAPTVTTACLPALTQVSAPALHSLEIFFRGAFKRGDVGSKAPPPAAGGPAVAAAAAAPPPEAVFGAWLRRQYTAYTAALLGLLGGAADAPTQVAAFSALLEFCRAEGSGSGGGGGGGGFGNQLFAQVLDAVLSYKGTAPEVAALLASQYLRYADVRYHALRTLTKLCAKRAAGGAAAAGAGSDDDSDEEGEAEVAAGARVSPHDWCRNAYDLLSQLRPGAVPGSEEGEELVPWCGAAAEAAADGGDNPRQRKKRRLALGAAAGAGADAGAAAAPARAKWASPKLQKRAYR